MDVFNAKAARPKSPAKVRQGRLDLFWKIPLQDGCTSLFKAERKDKFYAKPSAVQNTEGAVSKKKVMM